MKATQGRFANKIIYIRTEMTGCMMFTSVSKKRIANFRPYIGMSLK